MRTRSIKNKNAAKKNLYLNQREKDWDDRFILGKIPQFDAYNDINYLSLGLLKSKLRFDQRNKKKNPYRPDSHKSTKSSPAKRVFSATLTKPKNNFVRKSSANPRHTQRIDFYNNNFNTNNNNYNNYNNYDDFEDVSFEEDLELSKLYQFLKSLYKKLGVTDSYIDNIDYMLSYKFTTREEIEKILTTQLTQMKQFKADMLKIVEETTKRDKYINDLKKFDRAYAELKYSSQNDDNYELPKNEQAINQNILEKDIYECLKSLRLSSVNVVYLYKKFKTNYYFLINGKLDTDFLQEKYNFDIDYLYTLKYDTDFLKDTSLSEMYNFKRDGSDPFLLSISEKLDDVLDNKNFSYKIIPTSEDLLNVARNLMAFLDEEEILDRLNNGQNINTLMMRNFSCKSKFLRDNEQNFHFKKNNLYEIGKNFKGDMNKEIEKLIRRQEYKNLFYNTESGLPVNYYNFNLCKNLDVNKNPRKSHRSMTHEEITKTFQKYSDLKSSLKLSNEKFRTKKFNSKNKYK